MISSQLVCQLGTYLFTQIMSETVFALDKSYRVKNNEFRDLLGRLRIGEPIRKDTKKLSNLHLIYYDEGFKSYLENNNKTMWLFAKKCPQRLEESRNADTHL